MRVVGLHAEAPNTSPNTDGINFYGGSDQLFANSFVHNGDDCVSVVPAGDPQSAQCVNEPQTCRGGDGNTPPPPTPTLCAVATSLSTAQPTLARGSQPRGPSAASQ